MVFAMIARIGYRKKGVEILRESLCHDIWMVTTNDYWTAGESQF